MIDQAIESAKKLVALLEELKQATNEEQARYIVEKLPPMQREEFYVITDKVKVVHHGTKLDIEKYIQRRKLTSVYWRPLKHAKIVL